MLKRFVHFTKELLVASVLLENKDNVDRELESSTLAQKACLNQVELLLYC